MSISVRKATSRLTLRAYKGDAKTLLAWDLPETADITNLAGFTIECRPGELDPFYLYNTLQFEFPERHAQDPNEPPYSSINAPFHKFRWLHIPGSAHQGLAPFLGRYRYTVSPRFFDSHGSLQPLDPTRGVWVDVDVLPIRTKRFAAGFTRGFTQSQAFVRRFGLQAKIRPDGDTLLFDTNQVAGVDAKGQQFTYAEEYAWSGFTARQRIFELLDEVTNDVTLHLKVFAYDLNEPEIMGKLLTLAEQGRIRMILDDASLHHSTKTPKGEDEFETLFRQRAGAGAEICRGSFGRYAHDKVFVVGDDGGARKVLTGSTNFSVTGLYVNSNHVLVFDDTKVASTYDRLFETAWANDVHRAAFAKSDLANEVFAFGGRSTPATEITFAPHPEPFALATLTSIADRIEQERQTSPAKGSVLFAVMELDQGTGPVLPALTQLHADERVFSYGISDTTDGIALYKPGTKTGVLVTGKPYRTRLPPPFNQVRDVGSGHQVHHKFIVCGFNGDDPIVYCGSSNLALGGEENNGDNLLAIRDPYVATAFAIEAVGLVDHFHFLDQYQTEKASTTRGASPPPALITEAAAAAGWHLSTTGRWARPYFDPNDLRYIDRKLFAGTA
jgi:phosphatidylserine/phosphatidylglycerophosphate/cardiolipin synthase-like enzyme